MEPRGSLSEEDGVEEEEEEEEKRSREDPTVGEGEETAVGMEEVLEEGGETIGGAVGETDETGIGLTEDGEDAEEGEVGEDKAGEEAEEADEPATLTSADFLSSSGVEGGTSTALGKTTESGLFFRGGRAGFTDGRAGMGGPLAEDLCETDGESVLDL